MEKDCVNMETKTELRQIADRIGLGAYPQELEPFYEAQKNSAEPACNLELIRQLQEKYELFGEYYDLVVQSAEQINADPDLNIWVRAVAQFHMQSSMAMACKLPVPPVSENTATNFMMLHIMMPMIPDSFARMEERGFTWDELEDARNAYKSAIGVVCRQTGTPAINGTYHWWLNLYCRALIFKISGFWFEVQKFPGQALWLRNRKSGQIVPLMKANLYRDGTMWLGSKNYEDTEGAFSAAYSEDEEHFYGHACIDNVTDREQKAYPKSDWACVARPGEYCLGLHIPSKADISVEATMGACRAAIKLVHERFPEYGVKGAVFCSSWLLNPRLRQIQGPQSRITQFEECFVKYPDKDTTATSVFNFVFGRKPENLADLSENTSLQRKLKKIYMDGDCIHSYSGAIFVDE